MKIKNLSNDIDIALAIIQIKNAPKCHASFYLIQYLSTIKTYYPEQREYWGKKLPSVAYENDIKELLIDFHAWQLDKGYLNHKNIKNEMVTQYLNSKNEN